MKKNMNPGSDKAVKQGCTCPVMDNGYGSPSLGRLRGFYITSGCPIHDKKPIATTSNKFP